MNHEQLEQARDDGAVRQFALGLMGAYQCAGWRDWPLLKENIEQHLLQARWLGGALARVDDTDVLAAELGALDLSRASRDQLYRLASVPPDQMGAALFPVVWSSRRNALRRIRVGWSKQRQVKFQTQNPLFREAIDHAKEWVEDRYRVDVRDLDWWLEPDLKSNIEIEGGSVGWAAVVALASWVLRCPVPASRVFTGCLRRGHQGIVSAPVSADTLPAKAQAAAAHGSVLAFFFHAAHGTHDWARLEPHPVGSLPALLRDTFQGVEEQAEGHIKRSGPGAHEDVLHVLHQLLEREKGRHPQQDVVVRSVVDNRLLVLLSTARRLLSQAELDAAVVHSGWPTALPDTPIVGKRLHHLQEQGLVIHDESGKNWQISPEHLKTVQDEFYGSRQWLDAAHQVLAEELQAEPGLCFWHQMHTAPVEAAVTLNRIASDNLSQAIRQLDQLTPHAHLRQRIDAVLQALPDTAAAVVVRVVWCALGLPWPIAAVARKLSEQSEPQAQIMMIQALSEALLHVLSATSEALGLISSRTADQLDRRPSLGLLAQAASRLQGASGSPLAAHLAAAFQGPGFRDAFAPMNQILHGVPGLDQLLDASAQRRTALVHTLGKPLLMLLETAAPALRGCQINATGDGGVALVFPDNLGTLVLPKRRVRLRVEPEGRYLLWERGKGRTESRWWGFSTLQWDEGPAPVKLASRASVDITALPRPLAQLWTRVESARHPLEHLVSIELLLHTMLRFAFFAVTARLPEAQRPQRWRLNCRNLAEMLHNIRLEDPFVDGLRARWGVLWSVIDCIERLQHAPVPFEDWHAGLRRAHDGLPALLAQPWCQGDIGLYAADGRQTLQLNGWRARAVTDGPDLSPGTLAFWDGTQSWPLGAHAYFSEGRIWLLRQQSKKEDCFTSIVKQQQHVRHRPR